MTEHGSNLHRSLAEDARFATRDMLTKYEQRKAELLKAASKVQIKDRATAGDAADVVGMAKGVFERLKADREDLIIPYRDAATVVRANIEEFWADVEQEMQRVTDMVDEFDREERDRIKKQKADQAAEQRRIQQARLASQEVKPSRQEIDYSKGQVIDPPAPEAPPEPEPPAPAPGDAYRPIRGSLGARVGSSKTMEIKVVDVLAVPLNILNSATVHEAIAKVAKDFAKHQDTIPGLEIDRGTTTSIRRR